MGEVLKNRWVRAAAVLALLVGAYAWLGFRVAPGLVRQQAIDLVRERYGRELQVGELRLQPFKLQLEVRDLASSTSKGLRCARCCDATAR